MKVSFIKANDSEYMIQYDNENVFIGNKDPSKRHLLVAIELAYGEVRQVKVIDNEIKSIDYLPVRESTRFINDAHLIARDYTYIFWGHDGS